MDTLHVRTYDNKPIGTIVKDGDTLKSSHPGLNARAKAEMERHGSAAKAFSCLDGQQNGYVYVTSNPEAKVK